MNSEELVNLGRALPLMESFYTLQGEGFNSGKAAYFIRLGGCNVGCKWCDTKASWNFKLYPPVLTDEIVKNVADCSANMVVVTGGEPLLYNLDYLSKLLKRNSYLTCLETSGSNQLTGNWDWICLSPKKPKPPVNEIFKEANELKVIIAEESDFIWAEENALKVDDTCMLYLQPEWSKKDVVTPLIINYILKEPKWKISLQVHKYIGIP